LMPMIRRSTLLRSTCALLLPLTLIACGEGDAAPAAGGAPARGAAAGGGSVVLSSADIQRVAPGVIEEGTAISGNLRPIETVTVRARIEGDLTSVLVREGDRVSAGTVMAEFERTEQEAALRSAEADLLAARTESETAKWELEQTRELF